MIPGRLQVQNSGLDSEAALEGVGIQKITCHEPTTHDNSFSIVCVVDAFWRLICSEVLGLPMLNQVHCR